MTLLELAPPPSAAVSAAVSAAPSAASSAEPSAPTRPPRRRRRGDDEQPARPSRIGHAVLAGLSLLSLAPVLWMYLTSFRPLGSVFSDRIFGPFSLSSYQRVFRQMQVGTLFWHTVAIAGLVAIGQLITSLLAAYAFARWRFRGRSLLFFAFVGSWLVPFQVTMLPNYVLLSDLGLLNSVGGVILPQLTSAYAVILLRQHLKSFPTELLDAAQMDGHSSWYTLWRVVVPNLAPALSALGILLFISAWNEYFWPFLVYRNPASSVLQLGVQSFVSAESLDYGGLMAASGLACLPVLVFYLFLQRRVVNAFVRSGLK